MSASRKRLTAIGVGAVALMASQHARAQEGGLGVEHPLVVSLEHLAGAVAITGEVEGGDPDTLTHFGTFGWPPSLGAPMQRIGIHYFVAPSVSLGGLLHYSDNDEFGSATLIGARVGFALPLSPMTAFWLRGGAAYVRSERSQLGTLEITDIRPGGEVLLALQPAEQFGFLLGGMFEIGVNGKMKREGFSFFGPTTTEERDFNYREYGLTLGAFMAF